MLNSLSPVLVWAATYLLHSTLLLGAVWLWFRLREPTSHALREVVWKLAAVGGIVTASLQLGLQIESPINQALHVWSTSKAAAPSVVDVEKTTFDVRKSAGFESLAYQTAEPVNTGADEMQFTPEAEQQIHMVDEATVANSELMPVDLVSHDTVNVPQAENLKSSVAGSAPPSIVAARLRFTLTLIFAGLEGALIALGIWGLGRMVLEDTRFRRRLQGCHVVEEGIGQQTLQSLLTAAGINRPVTLLMADDGLEPGAGGWIKWQIVVPARPARARRARARTSGAEAAPRGCA